MPVHLIYGDDFLVSQALREMRQRVGPPEVMEPNYHYISAADASLANLRPVCDAIPFLAEIRLVVVEGALTAADPRDTTGPRRRAGGRGRGLPVWDGLEAYLPQMPPTTVLVFADGPLRRPNPLLERLRPLAQVRELPTPTREGLTRWLREGAAAKGAQITPGAIVLLSRLVGASLRVLDNELEKLALYAGDGPINEGHVRALVSQAREVNVYSAIDSLLEGKYSEAFRSMVRLREGGADFSYIVAMLARQLRQVLLAKELVESGVRASQVGGRLNIGSEYAVRKTVEQARGLPRSRLVKLYQRLLEADVTVKRGRLDEDTALQLLVRQEPPHR